MKLPEIFEKTLLALTDNGSEASKYVDDDQAIVGLSDIYIPESDVKTSDPEETDQPLSRDIADILLNSEKITKAQHEQIRDEQAKNPGLGSEAILLKTEMVSSDDILKAKAELQGLEFVSIDPEQIDSQVFARLDIDFIETTGIIPIAIENDTLVIAAISMPNMFTIETIKRELTALQVRYHAAMNAESLSWQRYDKGVTSYLEVIDSQTQSFQAQLDYSQARQDLLSAYAQLYKALGGGWLSPEEEKEYQSPPVK